MFSRWSLAIKFYKLKWSETFELRQLLREYPETIETL